MDDKAAQLVNLSTGEPIAPISQAQLDLLKTRLEQESGAGTNFRITPETLEFLTFLREKGADELAGLLAAALGDNQELLVGYAPIRSIGLGHVRGRLLHLETQAPLTGYKVEAYDDDLILDDLLGWSYTDSQGRFEIRFDESDFKDLPRLDLEGEPEVKLRILDLDNAEVGSVGSVRGQTVDFRDLFVSAAGKVIAPILDPEAAAVCPGCGVLYRLGVSTCSDCQVPLHPLNSSSARS